MKQHKKKKGLLHRQKNTSQNRKQSKQASGKEKNNTLIRVNKQQQEKGKDSSVKRDSFPEGAVPDIFTPSLSDEQRALKDKTMSLPRVYTDMYDEHTQQMVSFDEALELIKQREQLEEGESLIYAGAGSFAVVKTEGKGKEKTQVVVRKIEFEKRHEEHNLREEMHFEIPVVNISEPKPLSELYTDEEIANFKLKR